VRGGFDYLVQNASRYGFGVEEISRQDIDHVAVSSSKIRKAIQDGDMTQAQHFLGRNYDLNGLVVKANR
jgi:riboflavin kinase/FMN adenylyltransferase